MPEKAPVVLMEEFISLDYTTQATDIGMRFSEKLMDGKIIGHRSRSTGLVYVPPKGYDPISGQPTGDADEVEVADRGTVTGFTIIDPIQYFGTSNGSCNATYCHGRASPLDQATVTITRPGLTAPTWDQAAAIGCTGCHDGGGAASLLSSAHRLHTSATAYAFDCSKCHFDTVNTGMYILEPEIFRSMEPNKPYDWSGDIFPKLLEEGRPLYGYVMDGYWTDIGTLTQYREAQEDMLAGKVDLPVCGEQISPGIYVEANAAIDDGVDLVPPVCIGRNTKTGEEVPINPRKVLVFRASHVLKDRVNAGKSGETS